MGLWPAPIFGERPGEFCFDHPRPTMTKVTDLPPATCRTGQGESRGRRSTSRACTATKSWSWIPAFEIARQVRLGMGHQMAAAGGDHAGHGPPGAPPALRRGPRKAWTCRQPPISRRSARRLSSRFRPMIRGSTWRTLRQRAAGLRRGLASAGEGDTTRCRIVQRGTVGRRLDRHRHQQEGSGISIGTRKRLPSWRA